MGAFTWLLVAIIVLAVIGLGAGVFLSGITRGAQIIGDNPEVRNATNQATDFLKNKIKDSVGLGDNAGSSDDDNNNNKIPENSGSTSISSFRDNVLVLTSDQFSYRQDEPVRLTAVNIGDKTLTFADSNLGLQITNEDTNKTYSVSSLQTTTHLQPNQSKTITWYPESSDRQPVESGNYIAKIHTANVNDIGDPILSAQLSFKITS